MSESVIMVNHWDMKAKRNKIVDMLDSAIDTAPSDPTRALADMDEARKQLQALFLWVNEAHLRSIPKVWARP